MTLLSLGSFQGVNNVPKDLTGLKKCKLGLER